jgi:hypothetical protein
MLEAFLILASGMLGVPSRHHHASRFVTSPDIPRYITSLIWDGLKVLGLFVEALGEIKFSNSRNLLSTTRLLASQFAQVQPLTMSQPILLVLGYGPNIGHAVATRFAAHGYKVAIASRSLQDGRINEVGWMQLHVDLSYAETVPEVFSKVIENFGIPSVVVYNGKRGSFQFLSQTPV